MKINTKKLIPHLVITGLFGVLTAAFHLLKHNKKIMTYLAYGIAKPLRNFIAGMLTFSAWSVAEWLVVLAVVFAIILFSTVIVFVLFGKKNRLQFALNGILLAADIALVLYFFMCLNWGTGYYAESFSEHAGITTEETTIDELKAVTQYFADKVNETSLKVDRNDQGIFVIDLDDVLATAPSLFRPLETEYPFLSGPELLPKKARFSYIMSMMTTTGYLFPYTGESNINIHVPDLYIPSTVTHEISHQRGVASEQEANFVAILAAVESGRADFEYSGWQLGYVYLGNALHKYDYDAWYEVYCTLTEDAVRDQVNNNLYWKKFDNTKVQQQSDKVYDQFLKGYDQELGRQSYGAVVDLLIAYYSPLCYN